MWRAYEFTNGTNEAQKGKGSVVCVWEVHNILVLVEGRNFAFPFGIRRSQAEKETRGGEAKGKGRNMEREAADRAKKRQPRTMTSKFLNVCFCVSVQAPCVPCIGPSKRSSLHAAHP